MNHQNRKIENYKKSIDAFMFVLKNTPSESLLNKGIVNGVNASLNIDVESYYNDLFKIESLLAELIVQDLLKGESFDKNDIAKVFTHEYWINKVSEFIHA